MTMDTRSARKVSPTWTFYEGAWRDGNQAILGPRTHGAWLGSMVFDGARAFEGVTPDLDLHLARVNLSAANMLLILWFRLSSGVRWSTMGCGVSPMTRSFTSGRCIGRKKG